MKFLEFCSVKSHFCHGSLQISHLFRVRWQIRHNKGEEKTKSAAVTFKIKMKWHKTCSRFAIGATNCVSPSHFIGHIGNVYTLDSLCQYEFTHIRPYFFFKKTNKPTSRIFFLFTQRDRAAPNRSDGWKVWIAGGRKDNTSADTDTRLLLPKKSLSKYCFMKPEYCPGLFFLQKWNANTKRVSELPLWVSAVGPLSALGQQRAALFYL